MSIINVHGNEIFRLLRKAAQAMHFPRLKYIHPDGHSRLVFYIAGERSKYKGQIQITDGGTYGNNVWYGTIKEADDKESMNILLSAYTKDDTVKDTIQKIVEDPVAYAKMQGIKYSFCCFCGREITNKNSLTVGYGPICAERYGLPWEGTAEAAKEAEILEDIAKDLP